MKNSDKRMNVTDIVMKILENDLFYRSIAKTSRNVMITAWSDFLDKGYFGNIGDPDLFIDDPDELSNVNWDLVYEFLKGEKIPFDEFMKVYNSQPFK